ncbi:MAG: SphA family protein [Chthoniobacterales bacterium]
MKAHLPLVAAILSFSMAPALQATEGGGTSKALGVDNILAGVMPPPGLNLQSFTAYYFTNQTLDSNGNDRANPINFELHAFAEVIRARYVFPNFTILGGDLELRYGATLYSDVSVTFDVKTPRRLIHREDSTTNFGDSLAGIILGWHSKHFHQMFGSEVFLPTGQFRASALTNTSRGYYAVGPSYWFTWYPIEQIEISAATIYLFNFENPDTNYRSGQELSMDYFVGYYLTKDWEAGISGYAYKQVTNDEVNDIKFGDGNKGQVVAFGPTLRWHPHDKNYGFVVKWQHEELVENRTKGERFFFQATVQF